MNCDKEHSDSIIVVNATENNLKGVSVEIPKKKITVVTGVSGSGKSSLVFDTIAAESRRELNETFPPFAQQFLPKYGRPHVDMIKNLPVTIIIDQKKLSDNVRSTVGTYTDVFTFLRLLFARVGRPFVGWSDTFSFNHPEGKCPVCDGLGVRTELILENLIRFDRSLNEDAIDFPTFHTGMWRWIRYAYSGLFDLDKKIKDYTKEELDLFLYAPQMKLKDPPKRWPKTAKYEGIVPRFERSIINSDEGKRQAKRVSQIVRSGDCPACGGTRVSERVRSCLIDGKSIADVSLMSFDKVLDFVRSVDDPLAVDIRRELEKRLSALCDIGLSYLAPCRGTGTLSGGEAQRVKIAKHTNASLTDIVYVLDEPGSGLHPHDIARLKDAIRALMDQGNTILMVEHDPELIKMADHVIDMGPGAGDGGGRVLYAGPMSGFSDSGTATARDISERTPVNESPRTPSRWIEVETRGYHNLGEQRVRVPLGVLVVLCGVAGSGKTSLGDVITRHLDTDVISISQKNIGISLRSTPATYIGAGDEIRRIFARENKVSDALFSFNSKGACPVCGGKGVIVTDMAFMEDIVTVCDACGGLRYSSDVLGYLYKGKNIAQVMDMSVSDARGFFADESFAPQLIQMEKVGLDYLRLNQSLSTLSGGELQRLKLASYLDRPSGTYILDEPTSGLHIDDTKKLMALFHGIADAGADVIVMEHSMIAARSADWLIELGPGGGEHGGRVLWSGPPADIASARESVTAKYLLE